MSSYCAPKYVLQHARVLTYVKGGSSCTTGCNALTRSHDASIHHPQVWICHLRSSDPRSTGLELRITGCEHSAHRMCRWSTHTYMHSYVRLHTRTCTATVSGAARAATRCSDAVPRLPGSPDHRLCISGADGVLNRGCMRTAAHLCCSTKARGKHSTLYRQHTLRHVRHVGSIGASIYLHSRRVHVYLQH